VSVKLDHQLVRKIAEGNFCEGIMQQGTQCNSHRT